MKNINEAFEIKGICYAIGTRGWDRLKQDLNILSEEGKIKERTYKDCKIGLAKVGDQNIMVSTFDLFKALGFNGTEAEFISSEKNRFHSFVLEGEFGTLRRFYIAEISDISMFFDANSRGWTEFAEWFWSRTIPREFHYSSGNRSNLPEKYCAAFFMYAKKRCERGEV